MGGFHCFDGGYGLALAVAQLGVFAGLVELLRNWRGPSPVCGDRSGRLWPVATANCWYTVPVPGVNE